MKQKLKPIWLRCLKEFFEEAERKGQTKIEISASKLKCRAEEKKEYSNINFEDRSASICNAMTTKEIFENDNDKQIGGGSYSPIIRYTNLDTKIKTIDNLLKNYTENISYNSNKTENTAKHKSLNNDLIKEENIVQDNIKEIVISYYNQRSHEHRYSSFDYCYSYFFTTSDLTKDMEKSCLQLGFYLASWGMLRNSDLLQKSSKHYYKLIEYISNLDRDDWKIDVDKYNDKLSLDRLLDIYYHINDILKGTVTLTTKIMLGVFGSIPAFDRYFKKTFKITSFDKDVLNKIKIFYDKNSEIIDELANKIYVMNFNSAKEPLINYPKAKIIDMYGFNKSLDKKKR